MAIFSNLILKNLRQFLAPDTFLIHLLHFTPNAHYIASCMQTWPRNLISYHLHLIHNKTTIYKIYGVKLIHRRIVYYSQVLNSTHGIILYGTLMAPKRFIAKTLLELRTWSTKRCTITKSLLQVLWTNMCFIELTLVTSLKLMIIL